MSDQTYRKNKKIDLLKQSTIIAIFVHDLESVSKRSSEIYNRVNDPDLLDLMVKKVNDLGLIKSVIVEGQLYDLGI